MSVAGPLATGGRPADRPPRPTAKPGTEGIRTASPNRLERTNRDEGTGRVMRVSRLDAFDRRRRGYGGDCAHNADMGIM